MVKSVFKRIDVLKSHGDYRHFLKWDCKILYIEGFFNLIILRITCELSKN